MRAGAIAREAFSRAIAKVLDTDEIAHDVQMSGKTDPQIALEILAALGVDDDGARNHIPGVLGHLEAELASAVDELRRGGRVLPGVPELLATLHADARVLQSALTGNTQVNAAAKLVAFGLDRWIDLEVGAYGSDHADRRQLVPIALDRAKRLRDRVFEPSEVWVVGDTPHDLACARAAAVRCALVATGRVPKDELTGIGADAVLDDLSDVDSVAALLTC